MWLSYAAARIFSPAHTLRVNNGDSRSHMFFEAQSSYELTATAKKLLGEEIWYSGSVSVMSLVHCIFCTKYRAPFGQ